MRLAVVQLEHLRRGKKKKTGDNDDEDDEDPFEDQVGAQTRDLDRSQRRYKQMEHAYLEADLVAKTTSEELRLVQTSLETSQASEHELSQELAHLSHQLATSTTEVEERTRVVTATLAQLQALECQMQQLQECKDLREHALQQEIETQERSSHKSEHEWKKKVRACQDEWQREKHAWEVQQAKDAANFELKTRERDAAQVRLTTQIQNLERRLQRKEAKVEQMKDRLDIELREKATLLEKIQQQQTYVASVNEQGRFQMHPDAEPLYQAQVQVKSQSRTIHTLEAQVQQLRHQVVWMEEKRKREHLRQEQQLIGKEQESKYIWQQYVQVMKKKDREVVARKRK